MAEVVLISDFREIHRDVPNNVNESIKYTDGALLGVNSCEISIDESYVLSVSAGEIQYGTKRISVNAVSGTIPYCYSDTMGNVIYDTFTTVPALWDDPTRSFPDTAPVTIAEGYSANLWLFVVLGCDREVSDQANIICVLGDTLYLTEREAMCEYTPSTGVLPYDGVIATYNTSGNLACIGRITINVTDIGDGPLFTYKITQPPSFNFGVHPTPDVRDIAGSYKYMETYSYDATVADRNTIISILHQDSGEGDKGSYVTLPSASEFGTGNWIKVISLSAYVGPGGGENAYLHVGQFGEGALDDITWQGGIDVTHSLASMQYYSSVCLVSTGISWIVVDMSGTWISSTTYLCDGNIQAGVEDNVVTIDAYGNIKDSGTAIGDLGGGSTPVTSIQTDDYPLDSGDANNTVFIMNAATPKTFTLEAAPATDRYLIFVNKGAGACTVAGNGKNISGETSILLEQYASITVIYDGTAWFIL